MRFTTDLIIMNKIELMDREEGLEPPSYGTKHALEGAALSIKLFPEMEGTFAPS